MNNDRELLELAARELTPDADADRADFMNKYDGGNCSCHLNPPCGSCTHPGNPSNQDEDESCWVKIMSDFDLLEFSAKSIGITLSYTIDTKKPYYMDGIREYWNPLVENKDAFLLLAELEFTVTSHPCSIGLSQYNVGTYLVWQPKTVDNSYDLRRAITRAAAEIGKEMG